MRLCSIFKHLCPFRLVTLRDSTRHDSIRFDIDSSSARPVMSLPCPAVPFIAPFVSVSRTTCASRSQRAMAAAVQLAAAPRSSVHVGNVSTFRFDSFRFVSFAFHYIYVECDARTRLAALNSVRFALVRTRVESTRSNQLSVWMLTWTCMYVDADADAARCSKRPAIVPSRSISTACVSPSMLPLDCRALDARPLARARTE